MSDGLHEQGWVAPQHPGPRRQHVIGLLAFALVLLTGWGMLATGWLDARLNDDDVRTVKLVVGADGAMLLDDGALDTSFRSRGSTTFLIARAKLGSRDHRRVDVKLEVPSGTDPDQVAVRIVRPHGTARDAELLVAVPVAALPRPPKVAGSVGTLRSVTDPFDERIRSVRDDRHRLLQLRRAWLGIALAGLAAFVVAPLLGWRRARRRFLTMRLPGAGRDTDVAPPSSIDPIGAAVLVAGARPVDHAAAFAGHVLDLVERRQLPMRRSVTTPPGLGTLIGMHHADEVDDVAVDVLQTAVVDDGFTVVLSDSTRQIDRVSDDAAAHWAAHVDARSGFERVMDAPPDRPLRIATAAAGVLALAATITWVLLDLDGARALTLLVAVCMLALAATLGAWRNDARRWRIVARARRTERAQWLAWRDAAVRSDGPMGDRRNLPVLVAIGAPLTQMSSSASPTAVDLDAVTPRTIAALRVLLHGD